MIIALLGAPGSGKSSIADALGVRMSFADGVRREVAYQLAAIDLRHDWNMEVAFDRLMEEMTNPETKDRFRGLLQVWGTDFRRAQESGYWVDRLEDRIIRSQAEDNSRVLVVDDARFPNEFDMLKDYGTIFVRLESGESTRPLTGAQLAHESERHWPTYPVDLVLDYQAGPGVQAERIQDWIVEKFNLIRAVV